MRLDGVRGSVLIVDYRGYGKSDGSPSEQGLYSDAEAALAWLSQKGFTPERVLVWGNSLGAGVATELATRHHVGALVLSSTFTSIPDIAKRSFPFIPSGLRLRDVDRIAVGCLRRAAPGGHRVIDRDIVTHVLTEGQAR